MNHAMKQFRNNFEENTKSLQILYLKIYIFCKCKESKPRYHLVKRCIFFFRFLKIKIIKSIMSIK